MTGNEIREHLRKKIVRATRGMEEVPIVLRDILDGIYDEVEFQRQGNFTLAIVSASAFGAEGEFPTLYGMSKRNAECDVEDVDLGRKVALNAVVSNAIDAYK